MCVFVDDNDAKGWGWNATMTGHETEACADDLATSTTWRHA